MAISGRIPLTVWMGDLKLNTYAYVFPQLSVDCLLGVNTLSKNGMIIDCNAKRLYVAGTPSSSQALPVSQTMSVSVPITLNQSSNTKLITKVSSLIGGIAPPGPCPGPCCPRLARRTGGPSGTYGMPLIANESHGAGTMTGLKP